MFFKRQHAPEREERQVKDANPEPFLPVQAQNQPDEDYREALIDKIDEIDETKRDIKGQIHSNAIRAKAERVSVDQVWLRRAKDKIDHLTREREEVRKALHTVNERIKDRRRGENQRKQGGDIHGVFVQVAKERLPLELYDSIMDEAAERLRDRSGDGQSGELSQ